MITVLAATNRKNSRTAIVAATYFDKLKAKAEKVQLVNLADLPTDFVHPDMYAKPSQSFIDFQEKYLIPSKKFVVVIPEYNGGISGIFKLLIDASDITKCWYHKKAALTGVAAGRAGNLRGLDHLTNMLNYIKMDVLKNKLPISGIGALLNENDQLVDEATLKVIDQQIEDFLAF